MKFIFSPHCRLVALVEVLQRRKLRHNRAPQTQPHALENITIALDAIQEDGIKLVNIGQFLFRNVLCQRKRVAKVVVICLLTQSRRQKAPRRLHIHRIEPVFLHGAGSSLLAVEVTPNRVFHKNETCWQTRLQLRNSYLARLMRYWRGLNCVLSRR